ncbi:deaminase [Polymorphospora rubra]|uniref:deaminase n=1 Tax=Polymorphospora rubra TaxID=338584 RepID=UPI0033E944C8
MTAPTDADRRWLLEAIDLSRRCPPTDTAYCVGAIIVSAEGTKLAEGYSRESDRHVHAEEAALAKLSGTSVSPTDATIYSSLEPCSIRKSRPRTCTRLILDAGIRRVVFALREPPLFADCHGIELLREGGVQVIEISELGQLVRDVNAQVLPPPSGEQR